MISNDNSEVRNVSGITNEQRVEICNFLQGAVYCWCKNRCDEWFALRDLTGGGNYYWNGTPLFVLYEKHKEQEDAIVAAGKDAGWLLKKVIVDDKRTFEAKKDQMVKMYKWNGNTSD